MLADPALRTDPFDPIKYIPLGSDPQTYLSFGLTIRERFESVSFFMPPVVQPDNYLLDRVQLHADLHLGPHVRIFTQAVDARAPWKAVLGPIDQDRLDLEQAFVEISVPAGEGGLNITVGRLEPFFDLQRFAAIQEGPNVWQPFDSVDVGYTREDWTAVAFYAQPVNTLDNRSSSSLPVQRAFSLSGARFERRNLGPGKLSFFAAELRNDNAFYLTACWTRTARRHRRALRGTGGGLGLGCRRAWGSRAASGEEDSRVGRRRPFRLHVGVPAVVAPAWVSVRRRLGRPTIRRAIRWAPSTHCFRMDFTRCSPAILVMPISCT